MLKKLKRRCNVQARRLRFDGSRFRCLLLVFSEIVVELKALKELCSDHEAQLFNYMRIARKRVGYLINFGRKGNLEWKRFIIDDLHIPQHR